MDAKRLAKRHKRQVARARARVVLSEPDVRTPEEIEAAREAGRANMGRPTTPTGNSSAPAFLRSSRPTGGAAKTDA